MASLKPNLILFFQDLFHTRVLENAREKIIDRQDFRNSLISVLV
jgi:hypothetical protein